MGALTVVKYLDVFGDGHARSSPGSKDLMVVHVVFQTREEGLRDGVIPAHPGTTHRLDNPVLSAVLSKLLGRILGPVIGINPNSG